MMSLFYVGLNTCRRSLLHTNFAGIKNCKTGFVRHLSGKSSLRGMSKVGLAGVTFGLLMGTGYSIHKLNQPRLHILNEEMTIAPIDQLPDIIPTRQVRYANDHNNLNLTLYQYQTCPFCCKVRAFLDYYGISYDVIEVDPVLRQSIKWSKYKKVPILVAKLSEGYQPFNDSSMIISALSTFLRDKKELQEIVKYYPHISYVDEEGNKKTEIMNKYFLVLGQPIQMKEFSEERQWRKWVDDVFVHLLSPNVYRSQEEALAAFEWFSDVGEWDKNFPSWERHLIVYVGASAMYLIGKRLKKKYNLKNDVRESLYDGCNYWMKAIRAKGSKFMGGNIPNLADLAMYGVLSSIEGCQAFKDTLEHTAISNWYDLMKERVSEHQGCQFIQ